MERKGPDAHSQDEVDLRILRMFECTFSLNATDLFHLCKMVHNFIPVGPKCPSQFCVLMSLNNQNVILGCLVNVGLQFLILFDYIIVMT